MTAQGCNPVRRCTQDFHQRGRRAAATLIRKTDFDAFPGDGEWNCNPTTAIAGDAVAVGSESIDLDIGDLSTEARSAKADQLTFISSTSKTSVAFGGMTPPAP